MKLPSPPPSPSRLGEGVLVQSAPGDLPFLPSPACGRGKGEGVCLQHPIFRRSTRRDTKFGANFLISFLTFVIFVAFVVNNSHSRFASFAFFAANLPPQKNLVVCRVNPCVLHAVWMSRWFTVSSPRGSASLFARRCPPITFAVGGRVTFRSRLPIQTIASASGAACTKPGSSGP